MINEDLYKDFHKELKKFNNFFLLISKISNCSKKFLYFLSLIYIYINNQIIIIIILSILINFE